MMTFSRLRFYKNSIKPLNLLVSSQTLNNHVEHSSHSYHRTVQNVSMFSTSCHHRKQKKDTKVAMIDIDNENNSETQKDSEGVDIAEEIRAAKDAFHKGRLALEARVRGKKPKGKYKNEGALHMPVLLDRVLNCFRDLQNKTILDMTFGAGGHTRAILEEFPDSHVLALDRDPTAFQFAQELSDSFPGKITPMLGRFSDLPKLLLSHGVKLNSIGGVLMDLGVSSMQFDQSERGFSLSMSGPLDMRMDQNRQDDMPTAADVVNSLDEKDLFTILRKYGEERRASDIAHAIVEARSAYGRIATTHQLADIVEAACGGGFGHDKLGRPSHPATKTFQAIRIFVNNEMNELDIGIRIAHKFLRMGGVCVAIGFHSLETKLIQHHFYDVDMDETHDKYFQSQHKSRTHLSGLVHSMEDVLKLTERNWRPFDYGAFTPEDAEVMRNRRSRSAVMFAAEKVL